jgi:IS30 family transposase
MAQHVRLQIDANIQMYFCDRHSPWQHGTNENNHGLRRRFSLRSFARSASAIATRGVMSGPRSREVSN